MHIKVASIMLIASVLGLGALAPLMTTQTSIAQQQDLIQAIAGGFESISVVQDANQIVITITKTGENGGPSIPPGENITVDGPIIILPPSNETGQNGTVIVPEPLPPTNETIVCVTEPCPPSEGNVTLPVEPPIIIVEPPGNVTQVEPPSNVTVIDNGTVVIAPPDQPVTETPGNVTIIDPPVTNATEPGIPEECGCPTGVEGAPPDIQPQPPVADNETIIVEQPDINVPVPPEPEPAPAPEDGGSNGGNGGDGNGDGGNGGG